VDTGEYTNVRLQYRRWLNVEDATYDNASIYANDQLAWRNLATPAGTTNHTDREWRFHDVDISGMIEGNQVAVKFEIASDPGLELGGWTIDDFCVVAYVKTDPVCGDGVLDDGEECDDGNGENGDGCENDCTETPVIPETCGDGVVDAGEECDDGNGENGDGCENDCTETPDNPTQPGETEGGCGCRAGGNGTSGAAWIFLGAAVALVLARRRRG
jgi:MYXO-CTERM domain-containing protein